MSISSYTVSNSGIVLMNIQRVFDEFQLLKLDSPEFFTSTKQQQAVQYLQFMATGTDQVEESSLPLFNAICGLPLSQPAPDRFVISPVFKQVIEGVVRQRIKNWTALKNPSPREFRDSWFPRTGVLTETHLQFELTVEKQPMDTTIGKPPFSYSPFFYRWMKKRFVVKWLD